jgi:hypothetical protein
MDDKALRKKLRDFVKLGNELDAEAKRRYGEAGHLFHEAEGNIHIMDGDADGKFDGTADRQSHIRETAEGYAEWGSGAW